MSIAARTRALTSSMLLVLPMAGIALPWDKDMVDQPSVKPQETLVDEPSGSVPTDGKEVVPRPEGVAQLVLARVAAGKLDNPEAATGASLERGKEVYDVHCLACHGASGKGEGLVGQKFVPSPMDLTNDYVQKMPDGQMYFTITHGSIVMPFYHDAIEPADRWHTVNYIKQGLVSQ